MKTPRLRHRWPRLRLLWLALAVGCGPSPATPNASHADAAFAPDADADAAFAPDASTPPDAAFTPAPDAGPPPPDAGPIASPCNSNLDIASAPPIAVRTSADGAP